MYAHGRYSALVRRQYRDLPGSVAVRWPLLSLGMLFARAAQLIGRVVTAKNGPKLEFLLHLPGIVAGLTAWNLGFTKEAFRPKLKPNNEDE